MIRNASNPDEVRLAKFIDKSLVTLEQFLKEKEILERIYKRGGCTKGLICLNAASHTQVPTHFVVISQPIKGITLQTFYKENRVGGLDYNCIKYIMQQILEAVGFMHDTLQIGNRDLNSDTILIDPETLDVTLIDFGSGCFDSMCDTFNDFSSYSSPILMKKYELQKLLREDINENKRDSDFVTMMQRRLDAMKMTFYDVRYADIFSIGLILWELLFCTLPYTGDSLFKLKEGLPVSPDKLRENILASLGKEVPPLCESSAKLTKEELTHLYGLAKDLIKCGLYEGCDDLDGHSLKDAPSKCSRSRAIDKNINEKQLSIQKKSPEDYKTVFDEYNDKTKAVLKDSLQSIVNDMEKDEGSSMSKEIQFVKDNYYVIKTLGAGGQGQTQLVKDKTTGQHYILKIFKKESYFVQELKMLRKINKNGCLDTLLCFYRQVIDDNTMKYGILTKVFEGITLGEFLFGQIDRRETILVENLVEIMYNLLSALDYLHNTVNIAHVDLKPENILINPETLKTQIIDFGSACDNNRCQIIETKMYAPPERLVQPKLFGDLESLKKSDVFSLGLVFYLLANNRFPFKMWTEHENWENKTFYDLLLVRQNPALIHMWNNTDKWINSYKQTPKRFYIENEIKSNYHRRTEKDFVEIGTEIDKLIGAMLLYRKNSDDTLAPGFRFSAEQAYEYVQHIRDEVLTKNLVLLNLSEK